MRDLPNRNPIVTYWVKTLASTRDVANDLRRSLSEKLRFERFVVPGGNPRCGFVDEVGAVAAAGRDEVAFRVFLSLLDQLTTLSSRQFAEATGADPSLTRLARYDPLVCGLVEWHRSLAGVVAPGRVEAPSRFLEEQWFVDDSTGDAPTTVPPPRQRSHAGDS